MIDAATFVILFVALVLLIAIVGDVAMQYFYPEDDHDPH